MKSRTSFLVRFSIAIIVTLLFVAGAKAQTAYGVNESGLLFSFDVDNPSVVSSLGPIGFLPEGIDFRPGTSDLYALDVGPNTTQLYTLNIANGTPTAVGAGLTSTGSVNGVNYDLTVNQSFGFDFNPTTLQADLSMRIRLISTSGTNLRLNSSTGQIAVVDTNLAFANGNSPFTDAAAYINNYSPAGGATQLFDMDARNNALLLQSPPNAGTVSIVGQFGATINNTSSGIGFDIYTTPGNLDPSLSGDFGFAVLKRPDAPLGGPLGAYVLYDVNLATGEIANGALVGPQAAPFDFTGGFAVRPGIVPEPMGLVSLAIGATLLSLFRRK